MGRVVITGVAGFLGSHLADKFLAEGYEVVGIDYLKGGDLDNVPAGVDFHWLDLTESETLDHIAFADAEIVVHAACIATEGLSVFSPSLVTKSVYQATVNTVTAAVKAGAKRFIYLSSMARYGDHGRMMFTEDFEPRPQDPYGISKYAAEMVARNICETHGLDWTVIVPHNIIGARQKFDDPFRNVASIFTNRMLQGKQPIIYGDGEQRRSFTFVQDVVQPLYLACKNDSAIGQVINVGPDAENTTIKQLAKEIADYLGFELDPIYMPGRPNEVPIALCSAHKARELLGYKTHTILQAGLADLIEYIKAKGPKPFDYHLPIEIENERTPATWSKRLM